MEIINFIFQCLLVKKNHLWILANQYIAAYSVMENKNTAIYTDVCT
jgi:hypothetical protein